MRIRCRKARLKQRKKVPRLSLKVRISSDSYKFMGEQQSERQSERQIKHLSKGSERQVSQVNGKGDGNELKHVSSSASP